MRFRFARTSASATTLATTFMRFVDQFSHIDFSLFEFQFFAGTRYDVAGRHIAGCIKQFLFIFFLLRFAVVRTFYWRLRFLFVVMLGAQWMR